MEEGADERATRGPKGFDAGMGDFWRLIVL
jgi:hypothetical protein